MTQTYEDFLSGELEKLGTDETTRPKTFSYPDWIDHGSYWVHTYPQLSDEWFFEHRNRLTSSNFSAALGWSDSISIEELHESIQHYEPLTAETRKKVMRLHGIATESSGRNWYVKRFGVKVSEIGLAVPKWEPRIGCSADGVIQDDDGIIEIKCPYFLYPDLQNHIDRINAGMKFPRFYHEHIDKSHYAQMQGSMKILNKQYCDYVVYATSSNLSYVERVEFNPLFWDTILWPGIQKFLNNS